MSFPTSVGLAVLVAAVAGAAARYNLRSIETRWQILAFAIVVGVAEVRLWPALRLRPSGIRGMIALAAAAGAITGMKFMLEPWERADLRTKVRSAAEAVSNVASDELGPPAPPGARYRPHDGERSSRSG